MFMLKLLDGCLLLIQVYAPHSSALYSEFIKETGEGLRRVKTNEPTIFSGDFNAYVGNDAGVWKSVISSGVTRGSIQGRQSLAEGVQGSP